MDTAKEKAGNYPAEKSYGKTPQEQKLMKKNKIISQARRWRKNQHMVMRVSEKKEKNRKENMSLEIMNIHFKNFKDYIPCIKKAPRVSIWRELKTYILIYCSNILKHWREINYSRSLYRGRINHGKTIQSD